MDYYKILGVNENSTSEEIEQAYEDLERMYNPSFNTSTKSFFKYRQITKAYAALKNERQREIYGYEKNLQEKINLVEDEVKEKEMDFFNFENSNIILEDEVKSKYILKPLKPVKLFDLIEINNEKNKAINLNIKNLIIKQEVSYLDFILGTEQEVNYEGYENCMEGTNNFSKCDFCNGIGKVDYEKEIVQCPKCLGEGEIRIHQCVSCNNLGYYKKKLTKIITLQKTDKENQIFKFKQEGSPIAKAKYKSDLIIEFFCLDKQNFELQKNNILIKYKVNKSEYLSGIKKVFKTNEDIFVLKVYPLVSENFKLKGSFKDYNLFYTFNIQEFDGEDIKSFLFIEKRDLNKVLFMNTTLLNYSTTKKEDYDFEFEVKESLLDIKLSGLGEKGSLNGKNGDLILKPLICNNKENMKKYKDYEVEIVKTSKLFNILGGKHYSIFNFGFRNSNSLLFNHNKKKIYILTGENKQKRKLSEYFILRMLFMFIWILLLSLIILLPFNKKSLIIVISLLIGYAIILNMIVNLKV